MKKRAKAIMIQGTGSGVGKSVLTAALCYLFKKQGIKVAPFKAQNMSLNSFATLDGLEMGRAQVYQAEACGLEPDVRMNPILLKPSADNCSQLILMGKPHSNHNAKNYYKLHQKHRAIAQKAYDSLAAEYDLIVLEGAGSPAEINLQKRDIVNMQMAEYADARVIIVGDIDKGGVFAWMKGTCDLIPLPYQSLINGFIINKFRGDYNLLKPGIKMFEKMVKQKVLGVIPYSHNLIVDEEDAVPANITTNSPLADNVIIGIIYLPHISNFTDFTPLAAEQDVSIIFARTPLELEQCDCIILPGSKATLSDANTLKQHGWFDKIQSLHKRGITIMGICGGYQMLGSKILDPSGLESEVHKIDGIGLLPIVSTIDNEKILRRVKYNLQKNEIFNTDCQICGYEIHMGKTEITDKLIPLVDSDDLSLCVISTNMQVIGTYFHGFFDDDTTRRAFINCLRRRKGLLTLTQQLNYASFRQEQFHNLAALVENNCDIKQLYALIS